MQLKDRFQFWVEAGSIYILSFNKASEYELQSAKFSFLTHIYETIYISQSFVIKEIWKNFHS